MYTTYHLASAQDITPDLLDSIKATFKSRPVTITVAEELDATAYLMSSPANKAVIEKSMEQDKNGEHVLVKHSDL
jgi:hypothetical protein